MVAISVDIEGQEGLTWPRWQRIVSEVERLGFAALYRSDHFLTAFPPARPSLELAAGRRVRNVQRRLPRSHQLLR